MPYQPPKQGREHKGPQTDTVSKKQIETSQYGILFLS